MPFFSDAPLDPGLNLKGDIGPGLDNNLDDQVKLASAIEKKTGAAPHADLGAFGENLANRFTKGSGGKRDNSLTPGFLGATIAAQVKRGTDTDGVVLRDGPTRDALINKESLPTGGSLFAPLPKVKQPVGPRQPNRPEDIRTLQGKFATIGHAPRVSEQPLFTQRPETVANAAKGVRALLKGVRAFQQAKGLKQDSLVNPGGPTERALDAQNEKARTARRDRFTQVAKHILDSDEPPFKHITNRNAAESMAGLVVGKEVEEQRNSPDRKPRPNLVHQAYLKPSAENKRLTPDFRKQEKDERYLEAEAYWENRRLILEVLAEIRGNLDPSLSADQEIAAERDLQDGLVPVAKTRPRNYQLSISPGQAITQNSLNSQAKTLLRSIRKYNPEFWRTVIGPAGPRVNYTRGNVRHLRNTLQTYRIRWSTNKRSMPGVPYSARRLPEVTAGQPWLRGTHGNAGFVPAHIAAKMQTKVVRNWRDFRETFWKTVGADPVLGPKFSPVNRSRMRNGLAPFAAHSQRNGKRATYEIHHIRPLWNRGQTYDMSNMIVVTPQMHRYILPRDMHSGPRGKR